MLEGSPHIAFVCWGFPPFRGSGAFRPLAIANALAEAGAAVSVVTADRELFLLKYGADVNLEREIDPRINVVRAPFFPERDWPLINDWTAWRAMAGKRQLTKWDNGRQPFPEKVTGRWLSRATQALRDLHRDRPVSLVMGTGNPYASLEAATQFGLAANVPVVLDDRDCSIANVYTKSQSAAQIAREEYLRGWLSNCAEMWFVNPPIAEMIRRRFPDAQDKIKVVENGWDPGVVRPDHIKRVPSEVTQAAYVGLIPSTFPLDQSLAAWRLANSAVPQEAQMAFIGSIGFEVDSKQKESRKKQLAEAPNVRWIDHISRPMLHEQYEKLDVLIFIKSGGELVTGGKPYEYAATGLPIAALVDSSSDTMRLLRDYPRLHPASPDDVGAAALAIQAAITDSRTDDGTRLHLAQKFGNQLSRERQLAPAIARVLELAQS